VPGRQVQDAQVLLGRPRRLLHQQRVVGQAEVAAGEQVRPVAVVGECPRLADQPVDDVPVIDAVLATAPQSRQILDPLLGVPHLDPLGIHPRFDPLADQPTGYRVGVALDVDGAAAIHPHTQPFARLQPPSRQRPQQRHLLGQPHLPVGVELLEQLPQEVLVGRAALEVAAAPQQQGLLQSPLELAVTLLHIAVLVGLSGLDRLPLQLVVSQQGLIAVVEGRPFCPRWDGGRQPVGAVQQRHATQLPQGVLQAVAEALVALREADRARLPIRVGQHEVVDQVVKGKAGDGHVQVGAMGEVAGGEPAGVVDLGEEHLLGRSVQRPPLLDPSLQRTQLAIGEVAREASLQVGKQGLGLQAGVDAEQLFEARPDIGEGVGPGTPVAVHASGLRGQLAEAAIAAGSLGVHAGLGGGQLLGQPLPIQTEEPADLLIGDHREPPVGLPLVYGCSRIGNSNCR
jgi:hypothetical protein